MLVHCISVLMSCLCFAGVELHKIQKEYSRHMSIDCPGCTKKSAEAWLFITDILYRAKKSPGSVGKDLEISALWSSRKSMKGNLWEAQKS